MTMGRNRQGIFGFLLLAACVPADAAEWTTAASVTPGVVYTDNVCLSKDNKQGDWIGTVTPEGSIAANGNRANLDVKGSVKFNTLSDDDIEDKGCTRDNNLANRTQFEPWLNGTADAILVENWFYIDAAARIYQNQAISSASGGDDPFNRTGNTNTTYNYSISPYIARRFKDAAELNLRYVWDEQSNSTDVVRDSSANRVQGTFGSVPGQSKYSWGLQGDYSKVSYDDSLVDGDIKDSELSSAQINQGYQLNRFWQVNGFFGQEWNDFVSNEDDIDGTFWDVGLRWTPNARTTVNAGIGDRFYGNSPRFEVTHSHKRSAFSASYAKTLTYNRDIRSLEDSPPLNPDFPAPPGVDPGVTTLSENPILDERFTLGYSWQGRRTGFGVSAFQSDQTEAGGTATSLFADTEFRGVSISANRSLSQQTSVRIGANWNEIEPKDTGGDFSNRIRQSETWKISMGVNRQLSTRTNLGLNYEYTDREAENDLDSYVENQVSLDLRVDI